MSPWRANISIPFRRTPYQLIWAIWMAVVNYNTESECVKDISCGEKLFTWVSSTILYPLRSSRSITPRTEDD